jgi:hypothetical protein
LGTELGGVGEGGDGGIGDGGGEGEDEEKLAAESAMAVKAGKWVARGKLHALSQGQHHSY